MRQEREQKKYIKIHMHIFTFFLTKQATDAVKRFL